MALKSYLLTLLLCLLLTGADAAETTLKLFVLAGQSNAQGWKGNAAQYPPDPDDLDAKIPFYYYSPGIGSSDDQWTNLGPQKGRFPKGHFGLEVTFARALKKAGENVAIFKYSLGSTGLAKNWKAPGRNGLYDDMVKRLRAAIALLEQKNVQVEIAAFIWVQGESDPGKHADPYQANLEILIRDFRSKVAHNEELRFILGVDEQHPWMVQWPQVVAAQKRIAEADPNIIFTSMIGLEKADSTHLKPKAIEEHGKRVFDAYQSLARPAK